MNQAAAGNRSTKPDPDRKIAAPEHLTAGAGAYQGSQAVLGGECGDHLARAERVFVDEHNDTALERSRSQTLGGQPDRAVTVQDEEPKRHAKTSSRPSGSRSMQGSVSRGQPAVTSLPRQAVADRNSVRRESAHQPQGSDEASKVASQVHYQSVACTDAG